MVLIRRVYSKSYHWQSGLTQVIILQLSTVSAEGVTLYLYTLIGRDVEVRTPVSGLKGPRLNQLDYTPIGCGRLDLNQRPSGYGPDELPLLHAAILIPFTSPSFIFKWSFAASHIPHIHYCADDN